jgi:ribosomal protein S18 acetylase RimI-like enzyme
VPKKPRPEPAPDALTRERAGSYRSNDGRFTVEQSSSGWLVEDAAQQNELGLPLARGPFPTLDEAKAAMADARSGPPPAQGTAIRPRAGISAAPGKPVLRLVQGVTAGPTAPQPRKAAPAPEPAPPPIVIRGLRGTDGDALRRLWNEAGLGSLGDDDRSLARMARRNPGLVLVAVEGTRIVGSALGAWDGRRGWIYHVATAASHRRRGIASRLLDQIEAALVVLGAPKVNAMVVPTNDDGRAFWEARGYTAGAARQFGKEL